jgi:hypothetical protein
LLHFPPWLYRAVTVLVYVFALFAGGRPERLLAGVCAALWFYANVASPYWLGERLGYQLAKDIALLVLIVTLAIRYDRWWLLVAGATGVLWVATDLAAMISPHDPWAFGTAIWTWNAVFLAALLAGTWSNWRSGQAAGKVAPALR